MRILFSMVSVSKFLTEEINLLVESANKYFLSNHLVDYVVFTDILESCEVKDYKIIKIDNSFCDSISCYQFQKVLSLNYINLDSYDYIFVHDTDQVYIGKVNDEDLLTGDLYIPNHLGKEKTKTGLKWWTNAVEIDNDYEHTSGNLWGGPSHIIQLFVNFSTKFYNDKKNNIIERINFFSQHPEEVMLIKFIDYYRIREKRISCSVNFDTPAFFTDIRINGNINKKQLQNFKLIHSTKVNIVWSKMLFDKSTFFY